MIEEKMVKLAIVKLSEESPRRKRGIEVTLLSFCRLQTICIFAQATGTIEVRAFVGQDSCKMASVTAQFHTLSSS